jgi:hypothetical protein
MKLSKKTIAAFNDLYWNARVYHLRTNNLYKLNVLFESVMAPAVWAAKDQLNCPMEHLTKYESYVKHDVFLTGINFSTRPAVKKRDIFKLLFDAAVWSYTKHYEESVKVDMVLDA